MGSRNAVLLFGCEFFIAEIRQAQGVFLCTLLTIDKLGLEKRRHPASAAGVFDIQGQVERFASIIVRTERPTIDDRIDIVLGEEIPFINSRLWHVSGGVMRIADKTLKNTIQNRPDILL
ncbi:hypothetical protein D3C76_1332910 [compost metagenome]